MKYLLCTKYFLHETTWRLQTHVSLKEAKRPHKPGSFVSTTKPGSYSASTCSTLSSGHGPLSWHCCSFLIPRDITVSAVRLMVTLININNITENLNVEIKHLIPKHGGGRSLSWIIFVVCTFHYCCTYPLLLSFIVKYKVKERDLSYNTLPKNPDDLMMWS